MHFNKGLIKDAAKMSYAAYSATAAGCPGYFEFGSIQGFTQINEDDLWIVFRGTDELSDWMKNLKVSKSTSPLGQVHEGFFDAWCQVSAHINKIINQNPTKHIIITGHSLGGALAVVAASFIGDYYRLITFGQPRVGDDRFCDSMQSHRYIRVVNSGDPVTQIPTMIRFRHCGEEIYFDHNGQHATPSFWVRVRETFSSALVALRKFKSPSLRNHGMSLYFDRAQQL